MSGPTNKDGVQGSHSSRVCGLKSVIGPLTLMLYASHSSRVCGLKYGFTVVWYPVDLASHSSRVCGLKYEHARSFPSILRHTLHGCVD